VILPLGDAPNPRGVPFVTYALIAANVAVYVLINLPLGVTAVDLHDPSLREYLRTVTEHAPQAVSIDRILRETSAYDLFVFRYGFRPVDPSAVTLFCSLFMHAGFLHLFGNMLFLWIYGDNVEHRLRPLPYLLAYLGTGVAATLFHMLFDPDSPLPLIGASGAISGVLGFYFLWFPRNQVRLLVFLFPFLVDVVTVPARLLLGFYLIIDNLLPFLVLRGGEGGVAHGAHIGGFLAGAAIAWLMNRRELVEQPREYREAPPRPATAAQEIAQLMSADRLSEAAEAYFLLDPDRTRRLLSPEHSLALANWLHRHGHARAALTMYRRHLRDYPADPSAADAHFGAGAIQLEAFDQPAAAYQHFLDALELEPSPETAARVRAALDEIAARQKLPMRRLQTPR